MACPSLREEFRLKMFGFSGVRAERFCYFQWRLPVAVYMVYRLVVMVYGLFWLIFASVRHGKTPQGWGAYLTVWTYTMLNIYLIAHFLASTLHHLITMYQRHHIMRPCSYLFQRPSTTAHAHMFLGHGHGRVSMGDYEALPGSEGMMGEGEEVAVLPWYLWPVWMLFSIVSSAALMVTIVFFVFLFPGLPSYPRIGLENLQEHLLNSIIIVIEHLLSAAPYRLLHMVYPFVYGLIYMCFSLFYWMDDHRHVMYPILDWNKPGPTVGYVLMVGFVFIPVLHTFFFAVHKVKMAIHRRMNCNDRDL
ncbi:hypothetical protein ACOMHN_009711 [Nucella lapillus]